MASSAAKERKIITDKLVVEKTGKTLEEWFKLLDKKGAKKLTHAEIFDLVANTEDLKPLGQWNQNLLTTTYEWDRGLKERGQKADGIEISVSKTVAAPIDLLYQALVDDKLRKRWLAEKNLVFRKTTENKSARVTWSDRSTSLSIDFYPKGADKSQIVVQHMKIADSEKAAELKEFWSAALNDLKTLLER
jgi:hypothetical protein